MNGKQIGYALGYGVLLAIAVIPWIIGMWVLVERVLNG
jgi:hypothetical protein